MRQKAKKFLKNNKGLTYLELMITSAIVAYIVLAYAQLFLRNVVVTTQSELRTLGYNYAADYMEEILGRNYSDITTGSEQKNLGRNNVPFTRQASVTELPSNNLKEIGITVTWTEVGETKQVSLTSYRCKRTKDE